MGSGQAKNVPAPRSRLFQAVLQKSHKMEEGVTTLPGSLGVKPYEWTTAHKDVPPDWLHQEGHPCMIGGRHGTMEVVNDRLICVVSPKPSPTSKESAVYNATDFERRMNRMMARRAKAKATISHWDAGREHGLKGIPPENRGGNQPEYDSGYKVGSYLKRTKPKESIKMDTDTVTESVTLRFSSPSRVQLAKAATYFGIGRATGGLGNVMVHPIQGVMGNWYFEITSNEDNQFLDPNKMHGVIPMEVTVTKTMGARTAQTASQDEIRKAILEMVEERLNQQ